MVFFGMGGCPMIANISQSFSWFKSAFIWDGCCIYHIDHNSIWSTSNEKLPIAALVGVMVMVTIGHLNGLVSDHQ
jgi:hypothetical protein